MTVFSNQPAPLARLTDPALEEAETVGDEDCYVVASSSAVSKKETFWISKSSHKIVKYSRSLEPPEGGRTVPEMAGDKLDESLKAMGQGMTEENKQQMKAMMDKVAETMKNANMKGSSTENHTEISSPDASADDFKFDVPEGAELKESLFGGLLGGMK